MARRRNSVREQFWRQHLLQQRTSGLSIAAYCRTHQLRPSDFYVWRRRLATRDREANPTPAFVPVAIVESAAAAPAIRETPLEIRFASGSRVRVRSDCDRSLLADVITMMISTPRAEGTSC